MESKASDTPNHAYRPPRIGPWSWLLALLWTVAIGASLVWNIFLSQEHVEAQARNELRTNFLKDLTLRQWATGHGGIYVPLREGEAPDPFIDFLPNRDITTESGLRLTLLNPATILRQYYELAEEYYGARGRLASLDPLNPANQPDAWERRALRDFSERGVDEAWALVEIDGVSHMRMMRPMYLAEGCLKCHARQGHGVGDVAGGLSIAVPVDEQHLRDEYLTLGTGHGLLWLLGLVGIGGGARVLRHQFDAREKAFAALAESDGRTRAIVETALDAVVTIDEEDTITGWNRQAESIFGWRAEEVVGRKLAEVIIPPTARAAHRAGLDRLRTGESPRMLGRRVEREALRKDGTLFAVELAIAAIMVEGRRTYSAFIRDISERKAAEKMLQREYQSQQITAQILETSMAPQPFLNRLEHILDLLLSTPWLSLNGRGMIFVAEPEKRRLVLAVEKGVCASVREECAVVPYGDCVCGQAAEAQQLIHCADLDHRHNRRFADMRPHGHYTLPIIANSGLLGVLNLYIDEGHKQRSEEVQFLSTLSHTLGAMIERHQAEEKLRHNAFYDPVTDLPNRTLLLDRLDRCLQRRLRHPEYRFAVLFLDLDRFKNVNDSLGHGAGDAMLVAVGQRLQTCVRPGDTVARLGGDEFAILLDTINGPEDAGVISERIHTALSQPFVIQGRDVFSSASVGIALGDARPYRHPEELLRDADAAMYQAKESSGATGRSALFDQKMHGRAMQRLTLETDLRRAVEREEFCVYYQPIIDSDSGTIIGAEALVRWQHPERGLLPPGAFIPLAENTGLIEPISEQVLQRTCRQLHLWQQGTAALHPTFYISVNLSARQFLQAGLVERMEEAVHGYQLDPAQLRLEITETVLLDQPETNRATLQALKEAGFQLYIDDFGTGYSSLSYLHTFPFDTLKIDRTFINNLCGDHKHTAMVDAIMAIARNFGMSTIAEGVETRAQYDAIGQLGCHCMQGYYFRPPLPAEEFEALLAETPSW